MKLNSKIFWNNYTIHFCHLKKPDTAISYTTHLLATKKGEINKSHVKSNILNVLLRSYYLNWNPF